MRERLVPVGPFDFQKMLRRPLSRPSKVTAIDPEKPSYTTAIKLTTRVVPVMVVGEGTIEEPVLRLVYPDDLSNEEQDEVRARIARMFSANVNMQAFYSQMILLPQWDGLINKLYGLHPIHDADLFESMVKVIIGQQLNVKFAATLVERLVDFGGDVVEWNGSSLPVFPSPEQVARCSYDDLRALSFSQRKAEYVIDFARAVVDGRVDLERFWDIPDDQIYDVLTPLRGIGGWTVECFLLFGMGRPDVMPAADVGVQNAVQRLYGMVQRPKETEMRRLAEPWTPYRSYATYYLWQSLIH